MSIGLFAHEEQWYTNAGYVMVVQGTVVDGVHRRELGIRFATM